MKMLSLAENESVAREADELYGLAETYKARLKEFKSGAKYYYQWKCS
jgi:hypothetical protein